MSRILVTGATGFVGRALVPRLLAEGHQVVAAVRRPDAAALPQGVTLHRIADIGPETDWKEALKGIDAVIHAAAYVHAIGTESDPAEHERVNLGGTRRLAEEAARSGVHRFVFVSTIKVNGECTTDAPFSESDVPRPETPYGISKWRAEQAIGELADPDGMSITVIRPPLIYGPDVRANFRSLLGLAASGLPLPLGGIANRLSLVYVGNLADVLAKAAVHPEASGTFLIRDGEDLSTSDLIGRLRKALGQPPRLFSVPAGVLRLAAAAAGRGETGRRLLDSLTVDDRQIRRVLGWSPPFGVDQGLAATAAWFKSGTAARG
jgi:nucleoside-diphosphate-sugar epimerase